MAEQDKLQEMEEKVRRLEAANAPMTADDYGGGGRVAMPPPHKSSGMGGASQFIIFAIIAAGIAYVMISFFAPRLSTYKADITRLENDLTSVRANYELKSDVPAPVSLTSVNSSISSLQVGLASAQSSLDAAKTAYQVADIALAAQIGSVKPYDDTAIKASIATASASIATLTVDLTALQTKLNNIHDTDLTSVYASITALQGSLATVNTQITALQTTVAGIQASLTTLTAQVAAIQLPTVYVKSLAVGFGGVQAVINTNNALVVLVEIKYTFATPIVAAAPPTLTYNMLATQAGSTISTTWDGKEQQVTWLVRVSLASGSNTLAWLPGVSMPAGIWSVNVEVSQ